VLTIKIFTNKNMLFLISEKEKKKLYEVISLNVITIIKYYGNPFY